MQHVQTVFANGGQIIVDDSQKASIFNRAPRKSQVLNRAWHYEQKNRCFLKINRDF